MSLTYFTDRDLGTAFPAILETAGIVVKRHADHFAHDVSDEDWLVEVSKRKWIVLTHDQRIRYKRNERDAVMRNGVALFVLIGKAPFRELAQAFVSSIARVEAFVVANEPPFIAKIYRASPSELARDARAAGRVEMWLSHAAWDRRE